MIIEKELVERNNDDDDLEFGNEGNESLVKVVFLTKSEEECLELEQHSDFTEDPWSDDQMDEEGEKKIDENGALQGDREFKFRVFKVYPPHRRSKPDRLYALSIDIARALKLRDSGTFYNAQPNIPRLWTTQRQRDHLVKEKVLLPRNMYRATTIIPVRSVFRRYGRRMIRRGRRGIDDYNAEQAATGKSEDEDDLMSIEELRRQKQAAALAITMKDDRSVEVVVHRPRFGETGVPDSIIKHYDEEEKALILDSIQLQKEAKGLFTIAKCVRFWNNRVGRARRFSNGVADWNLGIRQVPIIKDQYTGYLMDDNKSSLRCFPLALMKGQYQAETSAKFDIH